MANELGAVASWTFFRETSIPKSINDVLLPGEIAQHAFKTVRDVAVFTNLRLIVRDSQGITGKKVEQYSVPWESVNMWSSENAGHLDLDSEIELWTRAGHIKISLKHDADVRAIDNLIASYVLGNASASVRPAVPAPSPEPKSDRATSPSVGGMLGGMNPFKR